MDGTSIRADTTSRTSQAAVLSNVTLCSFGIVHTGKYIRLTLSASAQQITTLCFKQCNCILSSGDAIKSAAGKITL